jgi:hypothetical protein
LRCALAAPIGCVAALAAGAAIAATLVIDRLRADGAL